MKQGLFRLTVKKREIFRERMRVGEKVKQREKVMKELKTREWMKIVTLKVSKMLMRMKERSERL